MHLGKDVENRSRRILGFGPILIQASLTVEREGGKMGLDPGLGLLHVDQRSRDSLSCDLMEAVRSKVDAYVLDQLQSRTFK